MQLPALVDGFSGRARAQQAGYCVAGDGTPNIIAREAGGEAPRVGRLCGLDQERRNIKTQEPKEDLACINFLSLSAKLRFNP